VLQLGSVVVMIDLTIGYTAIQSMAHWGPGRTVFSFTFTARDTRRTPARRRTV
jgi:hypothetical protein